MCTKWPWRVSRSGLARHRNFPCKEGNFFNLFLNSQDAHSGVALYPLFLCPSFFRSCRSEGRLDARLAQVCMVYDPVGKKIVPAPRSDPVYIRPAGLCAMPMICIVILYWELLTSKDTAGCSKYSKSNSENSGGYFWEIQNRMIGDFQRIMCSQSPLMACTCTATCR